MDMYKKCKQKSCPHLKDKVMGKDGCPICQECNAASFTVGEYCVNCWQCEHEVGYTRAPSSIHDLDENPQENIKNT
jgi:hypothetical protein